MCCMARWIIRGFSSALSVKPWQYTFSVPQGGGVAGRLRINIYCHCLRLGRVSDCSRSVAVSEKFFPIWRLISAIVASPLGTVLSIAAPLFRFPFRWTCPLCQASFVSLLPKRKITFASGESSQRFAVSPPSEWARLALLVVDVRDRSQSGAWLKVLTGGRILAIGLRGNFWRYMASK